LVRAEKEIVVKVVPQDVMRAYWTQWTCRCFALDGAIFQLDVLTAFTPEKESTVPIEQKAV
jgi:hypothetical protein